MKLEIIHQTNYSYEGNVGYSVNEIRLTPRTNFRQSCVNHTITTYPSAELFSFQDYFGNIAHGFTVAMPHQELVIKSHSIVDTHEKDRNEYNLFPFKKEQEFLQSDKFINHYAEYLVATPYTMITEDIKKYAMTLPDLEKAGGVFHLLRDISETIYTTFIYDPNATHVHTTVEETLKLKRGVCQDFAHLMISICRIKGIPARYISGYHFIGDLQGDHADYEQASHAWIEAYVPGIGWVGFDPTNNGLINWRYVKVGHGRDYRDIVPVKGIYQGMSSQTMTVEVDVKVVKE
ncbi:transglutaminase family protein [Bacillus sp. DNRA2]|uniref:transglutaminase family protein n=1 Tax=Bacillus sp. DNRA2 TaxID=2723053 RepID=UPI00145CA637|nr:transglutaminase family protein [Bacillus sp. DNRA2]NMD70869.1 transglutaminase family protein [Bacillus sp. DNRA2]